MRTAIICIIFLACASVCFSAPILDCRCPRANKNVRVANIEDVQILDPRPYCQKLEVIVTLKTGGSRCLDPREAFTQAIMKAKRLSMVRALMKRNTINLSTTTLLTTVTSTSP
ncbi:growth-regulated alpha protein-like [Cheilinus undulatus]|uniref:growth-regulated alpha protein-like n=1 Tax=Cheilinus undulatus TaxID=241271 RepID=UPI001BD1ED28|nr:growth-regulated alpha protein-like [Cheilinus undulatus]XP_041635188.1 growth-regulated alpha protein-like [Cheilinus undulatus]